MNKKCAVAMSLIVTASLCGCSGGEISHETVKSEEVCTEEQKAAKIASEGARLKYNPDYGEPPEEVQRVIDGFQSDISEVLEEESTGEVNADGYGWVQLQYSARYHVSDQHLTRSGGVFHYAGHKETWYSTNEKAGQATSVSIPDKHVADDGTIRDKDGYICVASSDLAFYSIVMTSLGPAKVYDCGCSHGIIDIYTNW